MYTQETPVATMYHTLHDLIHHNEEWIWDRASEKAGFRISEPRYKVVDVEHSEFGAETTVVIEVYGYNEEGEP